MYTRTLSTASNAEQFYFQIKLLELRSKVTQNKLFKFSIYKGMQKLDYTKEPIQMTGKNITLGQIPLNFYIPSYNPKKSIQFSVNLLEITDQGQIQVGQFTISSNPFIVAYIEQGSNNYKYQNKFTQQIEIQYMLYIDKSRVGLISSIKKLQSQKNMQSEKNLLSNQKQNPLIKPFQKNQEKLQTPRVKLQFSRTSSTTKNAQIQVYSEQPKQLSQTSKKRVLKRTGTNNSRTNLISNQEKRKAQQTKNQIISSPQQKNKNISRQKESSEKRNSQIKVVQKVKIPFDQKQSIQQVMSQSKGKQTSLSNSQVRVKKQQNNEQKLNYIIKKESQKSPKKQLTKQQQKKQKVDINAEKQNKSWLSKGLIFLIIIIISIGVYYVGFSGKSNKKKSKKEQKMIKNRYNIN